jgi:3',5'-cyclic AMP phosphodiesterase CpdA
VRSDFVLLAGDLAYDSGRRDELEANVFDVYGEMMGQVPFFPASGNHDYATEDAAPFREAFALFENGGEEGRERWYSFDWGPVHVAVLDTEQVSATQASWLDADLAASDRPFEIVLLHRPPYSSGSHGSDGAVQSTFVPIFVEHGVDLVLAGHDHDYERTHPIYGVTYVVTGGGGRGTRDVGDSEFTAYSVQVAHFVHVTVEPTRMRLVAIDALGEPFDEVEIRARP